MDSLIPSSVPLPGEPALISRAESLRPLVEAAADEIEATRRRGYAVDDEEFASGIRCVARPVHDAGGRMIAAIGISGPSVRVTDSRLPELGRIVAEAALATVNRDRQQ